MPLVPACVVRGCDRRAARRSLYCGCHKLDRAEGRITLATAADELLPFAPELERKHSAGPCPAMGPGDAAVRESVAFTARESEQYRKTPNVWHGDPARRTPPRPVN